MLPSLRTDTPIRPLSARYFSVFLDEYPAFVSACVSMDGKMYAFLFWIMPRHVPKAFSPKLSLFDSIQSTMYCVAFSFTSPVSAFICSCRMFLAISLALSHDSGSICRFSVFVLADSVSNSPFSYRFSHSPLLNTHVSMIASASATAAMPAMCDPLFPLLIWYTYCIISSYFSVMLLSSVCRSIPM